MKNNQIYCTAIFLNTVLHGQGCKSRDVTILNFEIYCDYDYENINLEALSWWYIFDKIIIEKYTIILYYITKIRITDMVLYSIRLLPARLFA
jgi:hypothetical protein